MAQLSQHNASCVTNMKKFFSFSSFSMNRTIWKWNLYKYKHCSTINLHNLKRFFFERKKHFKIGIKSNLLFPMHWLVEKPSETPVYLQYSKLVKALNLEDELDQCTKHIWRKEQFFFKWIRNQKHLNQYDTLIKKVW